MPSPHYVVKFRMERRPNRDRPDRTIERARIVLGSRPVADVHVPDRLVAQEALELVFDGRSLSIDVKGRLAGVFVDGVPVEGRGPVAHGAAIQVGACLVETAIDAEAAVCTLTVGERHLTAAVGAASKRAAAPFALESEGPQEHRWGRSRVLRTCNWAAALAGILLVASFPLTRDTALVDRGPLAAAHAIGSSEDAPKDCAACHAPFSSDYGPRCAKCHEGYDSPDRHPFGRASDFACSRCHAEHRGASADPLPPLTAGASGWPRTCEECHAGEDHDSRAHAAAARPDAASRAADRAGDPVTRALPLDGFSHADHLVPKARRASLAGGAAPPQGQVPVPCGKCHAARAGAAGPGTDFGSVGYAKCLECHAEWRVDVHGREQGGAHCFQCHERTSDPAAVTKDVRTADVAASGGLWEVVPRRHDFAKDDCRVCHVEERAAAAPREPVRLAFRHDHHLRTVRPEPGGEAALAASCVPCHAAVAGSASLAGLGETLAAVSLDGCGECHTEGAPQPVPGAGRRRIVDMFHSVHTAEPGPSGAALRPLAGRGSLARGCLSCHVPAEGTARMTLREGAADCTACHRGHESLGGGRCALCHADRRDPANRDAKGGLLYRRNDPGVFDPSKAATRTVAPVRRFAHGSRGHLGRGAAAPPAASACGVCHDAASVDRAERLTDVAWPGATDPSCLGCHARERFHR